MTSERRASLSSSQVALVFALLHLTAVLVSMVIARQGEGWVGVFVWPLWFVIDLPWSLLCYLVVFRTPLGSILSEIRIEQPFLDYLLYPPFVIHGVVGTVWWAFVPRTYSWLRNRRAARV
jgi:hypothetical protein